MKSCPLVGFSLRMESRLLKPASYGESARERPGGARKPREPWAIISAEQPGDPAAQPVHYPHTQCRVDVRWQVEQSWVKGAAQIEVLNSFRGAVLNSLRCGR